MKKRYQYMVWLLMLVVLVDVAQLFTSCNEDHAATLSNSNPALITADSLVTIDTLKIPNDKFGQAVRYGRQLMLHTAYYIGPEGINGHYTGNKMNCTNCHRDAGTHPYAFNLVTVFRNYPQYRAREGRILSLAERINNCVMRPNLGKPLPLDGKEMISIMSYLKWLSDSSHVDSHTKGLKNMEIAFPDTAASSDNGERLYAVNCTRCHGTTGEGQMRFDNVTYTYPPLWGTKAYRQGSSMHRVVKLAQWLVANMPYDKVAHNKPYLTDAEALDLAAFINDDKKHPRPVEKIKEIQYPHYEEKAIDYDKGPFNDTFSETQHKYGPYKPIATYWKSKGLKPTY
jgi:thiosulfate dehydrogenase